MGLLISFATEGFLTDGAGECAMFREIGEVVTLMFIPRRFSLKKNVPHMMQGNSRSDLRIFSCLVFWLTLWKVLGQKEQE